LKKVLGRGDFQHFTIYFLNFEENLKKWEILARRNLFLNFAESLKAQEISTRRNLFFKL